MCVIIIYKLHLFYPTLFTKDFEKLSNPVYCDFTVRAFSTKLLAEIVALN